MSKGGQLQVVSLLDATTLTIASGIVTATQSRHTIAAETSTTDDLVTINVVSEVDSTYGSVIYLKADTGDTITIKHGTGNILLGSGADFSLTGNVLLALLFDGANWNDQSSSASAAGVTLTAKGSLLTYDSAEAELLAGSDGEILAYDASETPGIAQVKLADQLLLTSDSTSDVASITLSSIPAGIATFNQYYMTVSGLISDRAANAFEQILLTFNADTTAGNYDSLALSDDGTAGNRANNVGTISGIQVFRACGAANSDTGMFGHFQMTIDQPLSAADYKVVDIKGGIAASTNGEGSNMMGEGVWESISAITSITLTPQNGTTFLVGGAGEPQKLTVRLYGRY